MRLELQDSFIKKLNRQVAYIAADKPEAARKFKNDILELVQRIPEAPFSHPRSRHFNEDNTRHVVFKGYSVVFRIYPIKKVILVFGLIKYESGLKG